ncbi:hypothetical protein YPPY113_2182, partial [Yersinia pestis PY-113]|jgi:hypothetical protein
MSTDK